MSRKAILILVFLMLLVCLQYPRFQHYSVRASDGYPVHNLDTGLNYIHIQEAINANETLSYQRILVDAGVYDERIIINKSISLIGEDKENTILNWTVPSWDIAVLNITANDVKLAQFSILGWAGTKVTVFSCSNVTIKDNVIWSTGMCISLNNSNNCTITGNRIVGMGLEGNNLIVLSGCSGCIIENNSVLTACYEGIGLYSSSNNQIRNNQIDGDGHAVYLQSAHGNVISSNTVSDCWNGIEFEGGTGNTIFGNNFERNWNQVYGSFAGNSFNESSEGNYYSDYKGKDVNQDGIGDTPYVSEYFPNSFANVDYYPLVGRFHNFAVSTLAGGLQTLTVISNSTVSTLSLDYSVPTSNDIQSDQPFIRFLVTGEDGTVGFSRVMIPRVVMNSSSYIVFVGNRQVNVMELPNSNNFYACLYFTYVHSTHQILVFIPEFTSLLVLPLFTIVTLLAAIFYKKKYVG